VTDEVNDRPPREVAEAYEIAYRHGEANYHADWEFAFEDIVPDDVEIGPTTIAAYIRKLQEEKMKTPGCPMTIEELTAILDDADASLRAADVKRAMKIILVWGQRRDHLLNGEETWEDQKIGPITFGGVRD
jgi:hypothetical protein